MPLVLVPSLDILDRPSVEAHITEKRARRMMAAIEYHEGKNAKLNSESNKIERRLKSQYEMLGKEIVAFDKASNKIDKRLVTIDSLKAELGLVRDMIVVIDKEEAE